MSNSNKQSISSKAFDETIEVLKFNRSPIDAAQNVKKHAEKEVKRKERK